MSRARDSYNGAFQRLGFVRGNLFIFDDVQKGLLMKPQFVNSTLASWGEKRPGMARTKGLCDVVFAPFEEVVGRRHHAHHADARI